MPIKTRAKDEFENSYKNTKTSLNDTENLYNGEFKDLKLKALLKKYQALGDSGELGAAVRGELKALIDPKVGEFFDKTYEKIHSKLFTSIKADFKISFSQAKLLSEIGILEHCGRCLPLAKMFLVAASKGSLDEFFTNITSAASSKGSEAKLLGSALKSFHAKGWYDMQVSKNQSIADVISKLSEPGDVSMLLNTPVHAMAVAKVGDSFYFFDPNAGAFKFNSSTSLAKSLGNYLRSKYGEVIQAQTASFDSVVKVDTNAMYSQK